MQSQDVKKFNLPTTPGVYFFKKGRELLYIGKATSLRDRVRSYFAADLIKTRGSRIVDMVTKADRIQFEKVDSVLEALLLEAELIKKHQPFYNSAEKDDKSYNCVILTDEEFPQLLVIRKRELDAPSFLKTKTYTIRTVFGPFPHGAQLTEALKIIRRIFPYRDGKCRPDQGRPCFNRQIGLCPGVCVGEISAQEYAKTVRNIQLLFQGKKKTILTNLRRDMKRAAEGQYFERASALKKTVFALEHIHDVALLKKEPVMQDDVSFRIEAYDVAHTSGTNIVGAMTVVINGVPEKADYRLFKITSVSNSNDPESLREILERRFHHPEWGMPNLIVVDGNDVQKSIAEKVVRAHALHIPVVAVVKDNHHKARAILSASNLSKIHSVAILLANAEAHRFVLRFHRRKRDSMPLS